MLLEISSGNGPKRVFPVSRLTILIFFTFIFDFVLRSPSSSEIPFVGLSSFSSNGSLLPSSSAYTIISRSLIIIAFAAVRLNFIICTSFESKETSDAVGPLKAKVTFPPSSAEYEQSPAVVVQLSPS